MSQTDSRLLQGMTTLEEQDYLRHYAAESYTGVGEIVDLGCWLGSTTIPLAEGLSRNSRANGRRVHAYDLFQWYRWMDAFAAELKGRYVEGSSFLPEFERRIAGLEARVVPRVADLTRERWVDGPIEFLEVDAMKSWELCISIQRGFFHALVPGLSLVMHQDFKFLGCPWIHLSMFALRDRFSLVEDISNSAGVVFRLESPLPVDDFGETLGSAPWAGASIQAAYSHWREVLAPPVTPHIDAAETLALFQAHEDVAAWRTLLSIVARRRSDFVLFLRFLASYHEGVRRLFADPAALSQTDAVCALLSHSRRAVVTCGTDESNLRLLEALVDGGVAVTAVMESESFKLGNLVRGVPVAPLSPDVVADCDAYVIFASRKGDATRACLESWGLVSGRDFFAVNEGEIAHWSGAPAGPVGRLCP